MLWCRHRVHRLEDHGANRESTDTAVSDSLAAWSEIFCRVHGIDFTFCGDTNTVREHFCGTKSPAGTTCALVTDLANHSAVWPSSSRVKGCWDTFHNINLLSRSIWILGIINCIWESSTKFWNIVKGDSVMKVVTGDSSSIGCIDFFDNQIEFIAEGRRGWNINF